VVTGHNYPHGDRAQLLRDVEVFIELAEETFLNGSGRSKWAGRADRLTPDTRSSDIPERQRLGSLEDRTARA
jgi:hypothetical protein